MKRNLIFKTIIVVIFLSLNNCISQPDGTIFPDTYGAELIQQLRAAYKPQTVLSYDTARDTMYAVIDNHNDSVTCVYSGYTIYLDPNSDPSTDAYNKDINAEHTWPQSKGADTGNAKSDLHHLYPCRAQVNSSRGNTPYAEINDSDTDKWWRLEYSSSSIPGPNINEYSEKENNLGYFEPREDHKGNAARSVFYFYTMYAAQADADFFELQKETLRQWNLADNVDSRELERSALIAGWQSGKENPFVLDTTLVRRAYFPDASNPGDVQNPQNFSAEAVDSSRIYLNWTKNDSSDDVMIVWDLDGTFETPAAGTEYSNGESALGGTIIGRSADTDFTHSGLQTAEAYFYRAFSASGMGMEIKYSSGTNASAVTENGSGGTQPAEPGDIIISEIMQNPDAVYDSDGEWFEIYNASSKNIDINGWYIRDAGSNSHQINNGSPLVVSPSSRIVLGRNASTAVNGGVETAYQYSGIDIGNSDDEIYLFLPDETTLIDKVEYDGGSLWPDPTGASMVYTGGPADDNNDAALWSVSDMPWTGSAGDLGSPNYSSNAASDISNRGSEFPQSFKLSNYPNPFNPTTVISYQLSAVSQVELSIFNLIGQKVSTLVSEEQTAGNYKVKWNAGGMAGGVYFCCLRVSSKGSPSGTEAVITRKLVLLQ